MIFEEPVFQALDRELFHALDADLVHCSGKVLDDMELVDDNLCSRKALFDQLDVGLIHVDNHPFDVLPCLERIPMEVTDEGRQTTIFDNVYELFVQRITDNKTHDQRVRL